MKVQIWSDVVCPFCYIGKRNFEQALEQFDNSEDIEIQWKSFQLQPDAAPDGSKDQYEALAESKGVSLEQSKKMHAQIAEKAKQVGLEYDFDHAIPANTFNAHRLSHLAAKHGVQNKAEERLFSAYFTEGKNIDDDETLMELGKNIGLPEEEIRELLAGDLYADEVKADISKARKVGVQGVPFFVLNDKYAVSGAQPAEALLEALQKAYSEYEKENQLQVIDTEGNGACSIDGNCA